MVHFREACEPDLPAIVALLADDFRGGAREDASLPLNRGYRDAFAAIQHSPENHLLVGDMNGEIVACLQLTLSPGLSYKGGWRATIEGVRVAARRRGQGVGALLIDHAVDLARQKGCHIVQLTTNKARGDAQRFYRRLGFENSHEGFKLELSAKS